MSKLGFIAWLRKRGIIVAADKVIECNCKDINCHGWRIKE